MTNLRELIAPAVLERVTLLANHVLSREAAATQRLQAHQGAVLQVVADRWPAVLPKLQAATFQITPAGLLECLATESDQTPNLKVVIDASNPLALALRLASGKAPTAHVEGDSRLAGDVDWLFANVRWDLMDDLETSLGPTVAQALNLVGQTLTAALAQGRQKASDLAGRFGSSSP